MSTNIQAPSLQDRLIVVAIDFGTTYSGAAYALSHRPNHIVAITNWPSDKVNEETRSDKVPTKLRYVTDDPEWGFQVPKEAPADEVEEWFKL